MRRDKLEPSCRDPDSRGRIGWEPQRDGFLFIICAIRASYWSINRLHQQEDHRGGEAMKALPVKSSRGVGHQQGCDSEFGFAKKPNTEVLFGKTPKRPKLRTPKFDRILSEVFEAHAQEFSSPPSAPILLPVLVYRQF